MFIVATFLLTSIYDGAQSLSVLRRDGPQICPLRRSTLTIILDCWSTMFICAWVAVHPNIPPRTEWGSKALWRRANLMFWAVVAPEVVLAWAVRQWFAASKVAEIYNTHNNLSPLSQGIGTYLWCWIIGRPVESNEAWTKTHGHFLCMGGFVVGNGKDSNASHNDNDHALEGAANTTSFAENDVISFESFKHLIEENDFEVSVTEKEIEDKSKSDSLSKCIAIIQTSRFIVKCIARWKQNLALTELELITLALASLNAITYWFWWAKPYDVKVPVKVYLRTNRRPRANDVGQLPVCRPTAASVFSVGEDDYPTKSMFPFTATQFRRDNAKFLKDLLFEIVDIFRSPWKDHVRTVIFRWFFMLPVSLAFLAFFPIYFITVYIFASLNDIVDTVTVTPGAAHVPTFYAPRTKDEGLFRFVIFAIFGVIFGGVHCIGWRFAYSTNIERILWRGASVAITLIPFVSMFVMLISLMVSQSKRMRGDPRIENLVNIVTGAAITFGTVQLFLYVIARLLLLGQAAASLREQPPTAFQEINWISFFPYFATTSAGQ